MKNRLDELSVQRSKLSTLRAQATLAGNLALVSQIDKQIKAVEEETRKLLGT